MKTFKQHIIEGGSYGVGTPHQTSVEDGSMGAQRVNAFVSSIADKEYIQPEAALSQLETRLRTIGVQLKDSITINDKKGTFESALVFNGGRFGKDTDGSDINDDGISHKVGKELKLKGRYETLENGAVKVYAELG
jgi:hypothetical protein